MTIEMLEMMVKKKVNKKKQISLLCNQYMNEFEIYKKKIKSMKMKTDERKKNEKFVGDPIIIIIIVIILGLGNILFAVKKKL